jgi:hypothetical protein
MKKIFAFSVIACALLVTTGSNAQQDKSKRSSPPATVTQTLKNGATITINYSQPSLKGRTIGNDVEPLVGKVWRMGANEATIFETDQDIEIEGKKLPKGKYALFGLLSEEKEFTLIFNGAPGIWGTQYEKNKEKDVLQVKVKPEKSENSQEQLTYSIDKSGNVNMLWGTMALNFKIK